MIRIKNDTINNLSTQLTNKYPYLNSIRSTLKSIFTTWLSNNRSGLIFSVIFTSGKLVEYVNANQNNNDISEIISKGEYLKKYRIYHKHKLSDFQRFDLQQIFMANLLKN